MSARYFKGLIVSDREVMRDGKLIRIDFDVALRELRVQAKADLPRLEKQWPLARVLSEATRTYYATLPGIY